MRLSLVILVGVLLLVGGCASMGNFPHGSVTQVTLDRNNYKMIKPNAEGASSGFRLFGFLQITAPQHSIAMRRLYRDAGVKAGGAYALANVVQEYSNTYLVLFSIPTYRVSANVVEFFDEPGVKEANVEKKEEAVEKAEPKVETTAAPKTDK
jgi:hypothetical protein